jgi:uncharacterized protein YukE
MVKAKVKMKMKVKVEEMNDESEGKGESVDEIKMILKKIQSQQAKSNALKI